MTRPSPSLASESSGWRRPSNSWHETSTRRSETETTAGNVADFRRRVDLLLDEMSRLREALLVLHFESDTDLPFDAWVQVTRVRFSEHLKKLETPDE